MRLLIGLIGLLGLSLVSASELQFDGQFKQGGLIFGQAPPGTRLMLDEQAVPVTPNGDFVFGFGRNAPKSARLHAIFPDGERKQYPLRITQRTYKVQRINGLPPKKVTPSKAALKRIKRERKRVGAARRQNIQTPYFLSGFMWPVTGRISGVYGSQRILNGQPRQPHYGIDIARPVGTPVRAPADGIVTLTEPDLYFSGGTMIIDHGYRLSSTFLHLHEIKVQVGQKVRKGDIVATVGKTGRVTGPHLDWRMNWRKARIDPALIVPPMR